MRTSSLLNTKLGFAEEVKWTWNSHIMNRVKKYILWTMHPIHRKDLRFITKVTMWIYTVIIRLLLTYGAVVWWTKTYQTTTTYKLNQFQRTACILVTEDIETTPMEVRQCLTPLEIYIKEMALMTTVRFHTVGIEHAVRAGAHRTRLWREYAIHIISRKTQ